MRRTTVLAFSIYYLLFTCGCTSTRKFVLEGESTSPSDDVKIIRVITKNGEVILFDRDGGRIVEKDLETRFYRAIVGKTTEDRVVELDPENAVEILVEKEEANVVGTILVILGVVVIAAGGVLVYIISQWSYH